MLASPFPEHHVAGELRLNARPALAASCVREDSRPQRRPTLASYLRRAARCAHDVFDADVCPQRLIKTHAPPPYHNRYHQRFYIHQKPSCDGCSVSSRGEEQRRQINFPTQKARGLEPRGHKLSNHEQCWQGESGISFADGIQAAPNWCRAALAPTRAARCVLCCCASRVQHWFASTQHRPLPSQHPTTTTPNRSCTSILSTSAPTRTPSSARSAATCSTSRRRAC